MPDYLDKKTLYTAILKYKVAQSDAAGRGAEPPRMPDAIGSSIMLLCSELSRRSNFANYPFIDEMVEDAIEDCVKAVEVFDPDKSDNAFGYLSITAYYAFLRRIDKEKRLLYMKYKHAESLIPIVESGGLDGDETSPLADVLENEFMINLVRSMDEKKSPDYVKKVNPSVWKKKKK